MHQYLSTLHTRSHQHKKRFALLTSGGVTLVIFGIWSMVTFGGNTDTVVAENNTQNTNAVEISPFRSLLSQVGTSLGLIKGNIDDFKSGLEVLDYTKQNGRK